MPHIALAAIDSVSPARMAPASAHPRLRALASLIGRTPLLSIHLRYRGVERVIHAKAEHYNLTGSIKDRMALSILSRAIRSGALRPGDTIAEATSGNAGIALTSLGRALGHRVDIYMPDWMSDERKALLRSLGADLHLVTREEGGFIGAIAATEQLARHQNGVFLPCQFSNCDNAIGHCDTTGPELLKQMALLGLTPASARAARSWALAGPCARLSRAQKSTRWSRRNPRPCPPVTRSATTASRAFPMISSRPSSISRSWMT